MDQDITSGVNYRCDLRNENEIIDVLHKVQIIDAVFLTMGDGLFRPIHEISLEDWEAHIKLNLTAPFLFLKYAYPYLKKAPNPLVVLLSSTAGKVGFPESSAYCTTKHGIAGLGRAIREEWKPHFRVSVVYPGAVYTPIWDGREGFSPSDMISDTDFAIQLASILDAPLSLNLDEMYILPRKGVL